MKQETKRLFTAIELPTPWLDAVARLQKGLGQAGVEARFVPAPRLHLTLNFIGESDRETAIIKALERLDRSRIPQLIAGEGGLFRRRTGGDLVVWELEPDPALRDYQKREKKALEDLGLAMDNRPYRPHLTLARQARGSFLESPAFARLFEKPEAFKAAGLVLFWSDQGEGRLVYRPVRTFRFG